MLNTAQFLLSVNVLSNSISADFSFLLLRLFCFKSVIKIPNNGDSHKSSMYQSVQTWILEVNSTELVLNFHLTVCKAGVGNLRPAKQNHPACSPLANSSNCMARLVAIYFMNSPSLPLLVLNTYEELFIGNRTVL